MKRLSLLLSIFLLLISTRSLYAFKRETYINFIVPVHEQSIPLAKTLSASYANSLYKQATLSATPITWLLDYSTLDSATTSSFFKKLATDETQELGALLDISKALQDTTHIYPQYSETSSLLNSYEPSERIKLLDAYMDKFFNTFGFYPRSVAASYLDSFSLDYLQTRYSVVTAILDPNENTLFFPYFPAKNNALVPAQSRDQKISISLVHQSKNILDFPVYLKDLSTSPLNEFSQLALEITPQNFASYQKTVSLYQGDLNLHPLKLSDFGTWFNQRYPATNPAYTFITKETAIYFNPFYEVKFKKNNDTTSLTSLTIFNNIEAEDYRQKKNFLLTLNLSSYPLISNSALDFNFNLFSSKPTSERGLWTLAFKDQDKFLTLNANSISTNTDLSLPRHPSIKVGKQGAVTTFKFNSHWAPFYVSLLELIFHISKFLVLLILIFAIFKNPPKKLLSFFKANVLIICVIVLGSYFWALTTWKSGQLTIFGLGIWGAHSHDALVHLSLIKSFANNPFSFENPNFSPHPLQNYHFFYDYFLALIHLVTKIPVQTLFFQVFPPFNAFFIGILSFTLLKQLKFATPSIVVSLLAIYFAGSLGFIPSFFNNQSLFGGESSFWMTQSITTLVNPPFALSLCVLLGFLVLFDRWINNLNVMRLVVLSLLSGLLIQVKAYASVLLLTALGLIFLKSLITKNKSLKQISLLFLLSVIFTLTLFLPSYKPGSGLFVFSPLWFIRSLFAAQDRLDLVRFANAWQAYVISGNYPKLLLLQLVGVVLFFLGNLGVRILSLPQLISSLKERSTSQLIAVMTLIGLILPLVVVQKGNSWNSIQFSYYSLFFLSLLLGPAVVFLLNHCKNLFQLLGLITLLLFVSLPTTIGSLRNYTSKTPSTYIPYPELRLLDRLSQEKGRVLVPYYQELKARPLTAPKPLFAFDSTSYVTAFCGLPAYFADDVNLSIMNYDFNTQKTQVERFYQTNDQVFAQDLLNSSSIYHVYVDPFSTPKINLEALSFSLIFDDGSYKLYTRTNIQ